MSSQDQPPSEQKPGTETPASNTQPMYQDWRSARAAEREAWRAGRWERREQRRAMYRSWGYVYSGWIGGAVLIVLGLIFLFQNMGALQLTNWWALFFLIPAMAALASAWTQYSMAGRLTWGARSSLTGGIVLVLIAGAFLLNLDWGLVVPLLLILGGLAILVNVMLPG